MTLLQVNDKVKLSDNYKTVEVLYHDMVYTVKLAYSAGNPQTYERSYYVELVEVEGKSFSMDIFDKIEGENYV